MWGHACIAVICACACGRCLVTSVRCLRLLSSMCRTSEIDGRCVHLRGSDRCEISYAATLTRSMCWSTFEDPIDVNFIIGASPTLIVLLCKILLIYMYIRMLVCPASNLVPQSAPLNAQRANVGPASNGSKVDNIALKTATLVSRFS